MFDSEYTFYGKHADMVKDLNNVFYRDPQDQTGYRFFPRNADVYLLAPIIGFLYNKKANIDHSISSDTKIFVDVIFKERQRLFFNFQSIILLHDEQKPLEERLDIAFRNLNKDVNKPYEDLFNEYVLGGVEVLHEHLIQGPKDVDGYIENLFEFMDSFHRRYNQVFENVEEQGLIELARKIEAS